MIFRIVYALSCRRKAQRIARQKRMDEALLAVLRARYVEEDGA